MNRMSRSKILVLLCWVAVPFMAQAAYYETTPVSEPKKSAFRETSQAPEPHSSWFESDANWQGFYAGLSAGAAFGHSDAETRCLNCIATVTPTFDSLGRQSIYSSAVYYGVGAGYNYQFDHFILGIEAGFGGMNLDGAKTSSGLAPTGTVATIRQSVETHWLFTARPRLGYALGRFLVYATGGYALTDLNYHATFDDTFDEHESGRIEENRSGWLVGGGLEYQLASHWSVRGEYLYMNFGDTSTISTNFTQAGVPAPAIPFSHKTSLSTHVANLSVNYRF